MNELFLILVFLVLEELGFLVLGWCVLWLIEKED
jgi:hypothetical protein